MHCGNADSSIQWMLGQLLCCQAWAAARTPGSAGKHLFVCHTSYVTAPSVTASHPSSPAPILSCVRLLSACSCVHSPMELYGVLAGWVVGGWGGQSEVLSLLLPSWPVSL
ncbi:hypothetical protein V8C86DRAFT_296573 [Haematococcus lacustris]